MVEVLVLSCCQLLVLTFSGCVLTLALPESIKNSITQNSTRLDGSYSSTRQQNEFTQYYRHIKIVFLGLVLIFVLTLMTALIVGGVALPLESTEFDNVSQRNKIDQNRLVDLWNLPVVFTYILGTLLLGPFVILKVYTHALRSYLSSAKRRYAEYFKLDSIRMSGRGSEVKTAVY